MDRDCETRQCAGSFLQDSIIPAQTFCVSTQSKNAKLHVAFGVLVDKYVVGGGPTNTITSCQSSTIQLVIDADETDDFRVFMVCLDHHHTKYLRLLT